MITEGFRKRFRRIVPFSLVWLVFGIVYSVVVKGILGSSTSYPATGVPYDFPSSLVITSIACVLMGGLVGALEVSFLDRLFRSRPFAVRIALKATLYTVGIVVFLQTINSIYLARVLDLPIYHSEVIDYIVRSLSHAWFWSIMLYIGSIATLSLLLSEYQQHVSHSLLGDFFTGRYHHPRMEERIFMFVDMKSSTTLAERMGHVKYFELLNRYYEDITGAIAKSSGDIWQYVGDEVVITWTLERGLRDNDCLACFFRMQEHLRSRAGGYERDFGIAPGFKAGLHCGQVTTGGIGTVRKDIIFTGDVMNTTARIQGLCNEVGEDLLVSEALVSRLSTVTGYAVREIGLRELKGKDERVRLYTIDRATHAG